MREDADVGGFGPLGSDASDGGEILRLFLDGSSKVSNSSLVEAGEDWEGSEGS